MKFIFAITHEDLCIRQNHIYHSLPDHQVWAVFFAEFAPPPKQVYNLSTPLQETPHAAR